ncbi:MAG TPA: peptidylprolyl isomerase [Gemmatimonadaceae bacterium]|nr:peptidylprolyl isomerase [Gemmatimonadaceae bacterium]
MRNRSCIALAAALLLLPAAGGAQEAVALTVPPGQPMMVDRVVAVVGDQAILWTDVMTEVNQRRAAGMELPADSAGQMNVARQVLDDLVDVEILVQQARRLGIDVTDAEVLASVEQQMRRVRGQFSGDEEFRRELQNAGFGTPEEYRRSLTDQFRRQMLQQRAFEELRKRMKPADVAEEEITAAFEQWRGRIGQRPATVSFRQIVVAPKPIEEARAVARAKAESLLVEIRRGGDFESIARRESMDPGSRDLGGDLGWARRGSGFVPEFERVVFALPPGQVSPVVETSFGYHLIRVDRVQPAEVKSRHILIRPVITDADVAAARDTAANVGAQWRQGTPFETLASRYHDNAEERGILQPYPRDSLPPSYQQVVSGKAPGTISEPFRLGEPPGLVKWAVIELVTATEGGEYTLAEMREQLRAQLSSERSTRNLLDELRKSTYVSLRL